MTIEELKANIERFDKERIRISNEISKRKQDLKRFAGEIDEKLRREERQKIDNLEDILEDIEYDLTTCLDDLFNLIDPETEVKGEEEYFKEMIAQKQAETLVEKRDRIMKELENYRAAYQKKQQETEELADLIETTELELDGIIADLAEQEQ